MFQSLYVGLKHLRPLIALGLLMVALAPQGALAAPPPLTLNVSPGAEFDLALTTGTQEVAVLIEGNTIPIAPQLNRWRHPILGGAIAIPRSGGVTVIRIKLTRRVPVYGTLLSSPSQLRLSPGSPVFAGSGVISRKAVDFAPPKRLPKGAIKATSLGSGSGGRQTSSSKRAPKKDGYMTRVENALWLPNQGYDPDAPADPNALAMGPHVLYPIPLPLLPIEVGPWEPTFETPKAAKADPEVAHLWSLAREGDYLRAYQSSRARLIKEPEGAVADELVFLEASLLYMDPTIEPHAWALTPVERARYAYTRAPNNPMALQTRYIAAYTYLNIGFHHEASQVLDPLIKEMPLKHPKAKATLVARGLANFYRGKPQSAAEDLMASLLVAAPKERYDITLALAATELQVGRGPTALALLELLKDNKAKNTNTDFFHIAKAEALYRSGKIPEAMAAFEELKSKRIGGNKLAPWLTLRLGECILLEGDIREAIRYFATPPYPAELTPQQRTLVEDLWTLRRAQLGLLRSKGEPFDPFIEVLEQLRLSQPYPPINPEVLFELGKFYSKAGDFEGAVEHFKLLLRQLPDFPLRHQVIALVWEGFQRELTQRLTDESSLEVLSLYERFVPVLDAERLGDQQIFYLVAHRYLEMGLYDRAYKALSQTFFMQDPDPILRDRSLYLLIQSHRLRGDFVEALSAISYARGRRPSPSLKPWLDLEEGRVMVAKGQPNRALPLIESFVAGHGEDAEATQARLELGQLYMELDEAKSAIKPLREAVQQAEGIIPSLALTPEEKAELEEDEDEEAPSDYPKSIFEAQTKPPPKTISDFLSYGPSDSHIERLHRQASFLLPDALKGAGRPLAAGQAYRDAAEHYPEADDAPHALYAAAESLRDGGKTDEAMDLWRDLADSDTPPWSAMARQGLNQLQWEQEHVAPRH